jgi:hypothetical protein
MNKVRIAASILLALAFLASGAIAFIHPFPLPPNDGTLGYQVIAGIYGSGLEGLIAFSHIVAALLILIPRTRFLGLLLQLPMSIGILSFNMCLQHRAVPVAIVLLLLNLIALADPPRLRALVS